MNKVFFIFSLILCTNSYALFNDKTVEPFLGPYKLSKNITKNCPSNLLLMAMCSLGQLDLKHTKNLDFTFLSFKGINEGEMITRINGSVVGKSKSEFNNLELMSKKESYIKRYNMWFETETSLRLSKKNFILVKKQRRNRKDDYKLSLSCEYVFDETENKRMTESFKKSLK